MFRSGALDFSRADDLTVYGLLNPVDYLDWNNINPTFSKQACPSYEYSTNNWNCANTPSCGGKMSKKNSSAYALFFREYQTQIRQAYPDSSFGDISKAIAIKWDSLSDKEKTVYKNRVKSKKREELLNKAIKQALLVSANTGISKN